MPPRSYRHLSVKEEVYRRLEEFAKSKGLTSASDALVLLLEYSDIYSRLEYILQKGVSNLPQTGVNQEQGSPLENSPSQERGNPIDYVESGLAPSKKCVATKVGKSYLIECEDGARAYIPSNAIPDLVERFGLVVREKD